MLEMPRLVGAPGSSVGTGQGGWHRLLAPSTAHNPSSTPTVLTWGHP